MDLEDGIVHARQPFLGITVVEDDFGIWVCLDQIVGEEAAGGVENALDILSGSTSLNMRKASR